MENQGFTHLTRLPGSDQPTGRLLGVYFKSSFLNYYEKDAMRNFRQLRIWSSSMQLVTMTYETLNDLPDHEKYGLKKQMARSAVSIPSNIAEGCRGSDKELVQYLNIALGSSFELETQLEISKNLSYLESEKVNDLLGELHILQRQINKFRSSLL